MVAADGSLLGCLLDIRLTIACIRLIMFEGGSLSKLALHLP
jgi:hypothetical protein